MKSKSTKARMPRLIGAMFATAAIAACAFAGTAFAADEDGFAADGVHAFYDDAYALMKTEGEEQGNTQYNLIDTNYKVWYTTNDPYEVTEYGIRTLDPDAMYLKGLTTYQGNTLLDAKYSSIEYNSKSHMVFATVCSEGKVTVEQYARGTSEPIDTLEIAIDDKTVTPWATVEASDAFIIVSISYYDGDKEITAEKMATYTDEGMESKDMKAPEGYTVLGNMDAVPYGSSNPSFYEVTVYKEEGESYESAYYLPDGTLVPALTGYTYKENDAIGTTAPSKFVFTKETKTEEPAKTTTEAIVVDPSGTTLATITGMSADSTSARFYWGLIGGYVYQYGSYYVYDDESDYPLYQQYLPCTFYDMNGKSVKEIPLTTSADTYLTAKDKTPYVYAHAYAFEDESVQSYSGRYSGSYAIYLDENLNEIPGHLITSQNETTPTDEPSQYMLDGTKLYMGGKFAFDQDNNIVSRAGQSVTALFDNMHYTPGNYYYGNNSIRVGSSDAFIATDDKGKFGLVTSEGALVASECDGLYSQYNSELAMVKKGDKWYFVDGLAGKARSEMHRMYNPNSYEHFYTADPAERDTLIAAGWNYEGVGWIAPAGSSKPVFRMYNANGGEHHYTMDATERDDLVAAGWNYEGVGWFSDVNKTNGLYRDYNPNMFSCNHNYTASLEEHQTLIEAGWIDEGTAWYGLDYVPPIDEENAKAPADDKEKDSSADLQAGSL